MDQVTASAYVCKIFDIVRNILGTERGIFFNNQHLQTGATTDQSPPETACPVTPIIVISSFTTSKYVLHGLPLFCLPGIGVATPSMPTPPDSDFGPDWCMSMIYIYSILCNLLTLSNLGIDKYSLFTLYKSIGLQARHHF